LLSENRERGRKDERANNTKALVKVKKFLFGFCFAPNEHLFSACGVRL
jgi:hypothetical protein